MQRKVATTIAFMSGFLSTLTFEMCQIVIAINRTLEKQRGKEREAEYCRGIPRIDITNELPFSTSVSLASLHPLSQLSTDY